MRTQIRIVAGSLRGRKLSCVVDPALRPTPDRVREALFNILGNAVPDRPFLDLFAGTGVIGLEALSRGASFVEFVERDNRTAAEIVRHLQAFSVASQAKVHRADVYRWAERWQPPNEPVNVFLGPPFPDLTQRTADLIQLLADLQQKMATGSVLILQSEKAWPTEKLVDSEHWEQRLYGRNRLSIWVKEPAGAESVLKDGSDPLPEA
jgi:16S rRNA (guanine966-N2)-methyltransferase